MEETAVIEKMILFGISRQEAVLYLCLLKNGELTGYEVSKLTGVSRSNVYNGLAALVEHGAAYLLEGATSRYTAVSLEEFCDNRIRYLAREKEYLVEHSPKPAQSCEGYITIEGYQHILDKIHHMLSGASQRIYFSSSADFMEKWREEIIGLLERQIKVVLIADRRPEKFPEQVIFYRSDEAGEVWEEKSRQLRLIIDSAYVLTGEVTGSTEDTCLYSAQRNFVNVFKEAMGNEIKLIELAHRSQPER